MSSLFWRKATLEFRIGIIVWTIGGAEFNCQGSSIDGCFCVYSPCTTRINCPMEYTLTVFNGRWIDNINTLARKNYVHPAHNICRFLMLFPSQVPANANTEANKPSLTPEEKKIKTQELRCFFEPFLNHGLVVALFSLEIADTCVFVWFFGLVLNLFIDIWMLVFFLFYL